MMAGKQDHILPHDLTDVSCGILLDIKVVAKSVYSPTSKYSSQRCAKFVTC